MVSHELTKHVMVQKWKGGGSNTIQLIAPGQFHSHSILNLLIIRLLLYCPSFQKLAPAPPAPVVGQLVNCVLNFVFISNYRNLKANQLTNFCS